jgi:hypothetical protein
LRPCEKWRFDGDGAERRQGIYYQAEVQGETVTWMTPFQFPQKYPKVLSLSPLYLFMRRVVMQWK